MATHPVPLVEAVRTASRQLVRELGFTGRTFAGTDLSPSAVHALIEIEPGGITSRALGEALRLEKSSVSRMLRRLIESGWVEERTAPHDGRVKHLFLTAEGRQRVAAIHAFAQAQVGGALARLGPGQERTVLDGLRLYARALGPEDAAAPASAPRIGIAVGYRPGLLGRVTQLHALHYARTAGFGLAFERLVGSGLAEFAGRLASPDNAIWAASRDDEVVGAIAIDGEDLGDGIAHLRWFIVDDAARGGGAGRRLLATALDFVDAQAFAETHLWTFSGLDAARHLYEAHGFALAQERPGTQWGSEVLEQRFVRRRP